ncbi:hypothetical protein [Frigoribacterium sp. PhB116]|uniref:hypothetical protein n=1 Tax=Frigoribacterium sp. PhB116 TaxID=2485174 RepID=UPI0010603020|nr:hypothetical protein [Frigoribacterium sp. PhB116]TDT64443.1 hypothetical protein EDF20_1940 [Frigoribacterium sp. PhB116]
MLGNLAVFGRLGPAQSKQSEKLELIRSQTNGTLSKRDEKIDRLTQLLLKQHGVKLDDDLNPIIDPEGPQHPGVSGRGRLWVVPDSDL